MISNRNPRTSISNESRATTKSEGHNVANPPEKDGPVRCAIYAHTATAPGTASLDRQIADCRAAADENDWVVIDKFITADEGLSGLHWAGRPGLEQLLVALESQRRPFDYVLVSDSSRLSRNLSVTVKITNVFCFYGAAIYSVADQAILDLEKWASLPLCM